MLRCRHKNNQIGQIFMEYTMIIGVIITVLIAMNMTIKRGIQGMIKTVADQVGTQANAEQRFDEAGHLDLSYTTTRVDSDKTRRETPQTGVTYIYDETVITDTTVISNLGFQEEN